MRRTPQSRFRQLPPGSGSRSRREAGRGGERRNLPGVLSQPQKENNRSGPTFPGKAVKSYKAYIYLSPQYAMEQEEAVSIVELSGIDSVSRALENEEKENFSSLSRSLDLPCAFRPCGIPGFQIIHKGKVYQDWRGILKEYSQERPKSMKGKEIKMAQWAGEQQDWEAIEELAGGGAKFPGMFNDYTLIKPMKVIIQIDKHLDLQTQKKCVSHQKVFEASRGGSRKHPSSREVLKAVGIQKYVRGCLQHKAFRRVKVKPTSHGPSLPAVASYYHKMIACRKCRAGVLDVSTSLCHFELEEWMDKKKFSSSDYETVFFKREFDKKDRNHLSELLRDCGYSIPASVVQHVFQLVCPVSTAAARSIRKHQAVEMAFTLFPPLGAKGKNPITVQLPWVHPLMAGKDGSKKSDFDYIIDKNSGGDKNSSSNEIMMYMFNLRDIASKIKRGDIEEL
ncbi:LOW QUALITY PROTEIN: IQ domain-containing protein M [Athene noctua]|uniref:LOW QUALITY PROTEIN: IQ domain-containing protein M n=1 Tax=Athene noctua TaxID=126797 RepID=UPI003EB79AB7